MHPASIQNALGVLAVFIFGVLILIFVWVTGILRKVWNVLTCGKCCQGKTVYLKADLELVIDDIKMWGISSYNIFENP